MQNIFKVARWEWGWGMGKKGEGSKKYKFVVTEQSRGCKVQHRAFHANRALANIVNVPKTHPIF